MQRVYLGTAIGLLVMASSNGADLPILATNIANPLVPPGTSVAEFQVKRGFRVEVVATGPMVSSPAAMAFDEAGRLFVAEMWDYPITREERPRFGRIRLLRDTNGDGVYDSSTIFADDLASPSAIFCYGGGVFVMSAPDLFYFKDAATNGLPDIRRTVISGFGAPRGRFAGYNLPNNFVWGLDNRIHAGAGDFGGKLQIGAGEATLMGNNGFAFDPVSATVTLESGDADSGCAFDSRGRQFVCSPAHPLRQVMIRKYASARNPCVAVPLPLADCINPAELIYRIAIPTNAAGFAPVVGDFWRQARGCTIYRGNVFPANYFGNAFIADPEAHIIHRAVLRDNGLEVVAERAADEPGTEFLMSRDPAFHPVQIVNGPDGALYIADMMTGGDSGRILRIVPEGVRLPKQQAIANTVRDLVVALAHPNGWHRDTAARLLVERQDISAVPLLVSMLNRSQLPYARLHALCVLDGIGGLSEGAILRGIADPDDAVRERAVLLAENVATNGLVSDALWTQLKSLVNDPSPRVRYQLCFTAGELRHPDKAHVLADLFSREPQNPWFQAALLSSGTDGGGDLLAALASGPGWADTSIPGIISRLALSIGIQGRTADIQQTLNFVIHSRLSDEQAFTILAGLGDGLHRAGSSLAAFDPQNRLQPFYEEGLKVMFNDGLPDGIRLQALKFRSYTPFTDYASGDILHLLFGTRQSEAIQSAALFALSHYANPGVPGTIFQRWPELPARVRIRAIDALLTRGDWIDQIIGALDSGQIKPADFSSSQIDMMRNWPDQRVARRATRIFGPGAVRRADVVAQFTPSLNLIGSAERGRDIFAARCVACHRVADGRQPMPLELAHVRSWNRDRILSAIIEPNAEIRASWATYLIESNSGEVWTGLLADNGLETVTLSPPGHEPIVLPRHNLQSILRQTWSLMPAGLESGLDQQSMADMLEYISPRLPIPRRR